MKQKVSDLWATWNRIQRDLNSNTLEQSKRETQFIIDLQKSFAVGVIPATNPRDFGNYTV